MEGKLNKLRYNLKSLGCDLAADRINKIADRVNLRNDELPRIIHRDLTDRVKYELVGRGIGDNDLAKEESIDDITALLELIDLGDAKCAYCGDTIRTRTELPLDRVDNYKGYSLGNVVFACKKCNFQKGTRTLEDFLTTAAKIYSNLGPSVGAAIQKIQNEVNDLKDKIDYVKYHRYIAEEEIRQAPQRQPIATRTLRNQNTYAEEIARALLLTNFDIKDTVAYLRSTIRGTGSDLPYSWDQETFEGFIKGDGESNSLAHRIMNEPHLAPDMSPEEKEHFLQRFKRAPPIPGRKERSFWASLRSKRVRKPRNSIPPQPLTAGE